MNEPNSPHNEPPSNRMGPGDRLQAARIALGLTLDDVASKMHLSASILTSLEENRFEDITAPIFVKGYLRSYARIVNLDEHEIINEYANYAQLGDPPITSTSNTSREVNISDTRFKGGTWLVILVMLGLLVTWWWNRQDQLQETLSLETGGETAEQEMVDETPVIEPQEPLDSAPTEIEEAVDSQAVAVVNQQMASDMEQGIIESEQSGNGQSAEDVEAEPALDNLTDGNTLEPGDTQEMVSTEQESAQEELEPVALMDADVAAPEPIPEPVSQTEATSSGLVINVVADTWADVRDADGNKLVYDLLRAGRTLEIDGKAPFTAFLGNGYGVTLRYQGEPIELEGKIRADNTVRLSIGQ